MKILVKKQRKKQTYRWYSRRIKNLLNNKRIREQFPVYNGRIEEKLHHKPYGSGVKINEGLENAGGMYLGVDKNVNNTDFPVVTMVLSLQKEHKHIKCI